MLIPGFASTMNSWGFQYRWLKKYFKVITVDNYVGGSGRTNNGREITDAANRINELLKLLEIEETSLLGSSMGAMIALEFAQRYPEKISALVLASLPIEHSQIFKYLFERQSSPPQEHNDEAFFKKLWSLLFSQDFINGDRFRVLSSLSMQAGASFPRYVLYNQLCATEAWRESKRWAKGCHCPCLFIYGSEDQLISKDTTIKKLEAVFHDAAIKIIEGAGHAVHIEKHREFNNVVFDFLKNRTDDYASPEGCRKKYQKRR